MAGFFGGVHPNDNTATVWLQTQDLIDLVSEHGNTVTAFDASAIQLVQ